MNEFTKKITRAGIIAGLYVVLIFPTVSFASGMVQFRPSEALTLLPLFMPESIVALAVGCMLANLITGCVLLDIIFGAIITLCAGVVTYIVGKTVRKRWLKILLGGIAPVTFNAFLLPVVWYLAYGQLEVMYIINVVSLLISQSLSIYLLGGILFSSERANKLLSGGYSK